eukprot:CAMPEP_0197193926 /NCGR_PEP_ID=MMETSP1423-20130617/28260_1 /TAXON_ID=476441 /ORGANISM="Pseudo-nitzschia heimii, Strain UNC1101" /LENGTH=754 /DNA_ID=CAMNT_0042647253 /DNA_START=131 /DNA_END=2392 /DNA_ORIENTATION=-
MTSLTNATYSGSLKRTDSDESKPLSSATVANANSTKDEDNNHDSLASPAPEKSIEDRWTPQPLWSIAPGWSEKEKDGPGHVSDQCFQGMVNFFQHVNPNGTLIGNDEWLSAARLSVALESSSHLTGVRSLLMQPWVYAGGGLGNVDECLSLNNDRPKDPLVHVCLAGGTSRDSLTFASACVVAECSAEDVFADAFPSRIAMAGYRAENNVNAKEFEVDYSELLSEYVTVHTRIARIGDYLGTGWVCGQYVVDWQPVPSLVWCCAIGLCAIFTYFGTQRRRNEDDRKSDVKNEKTLRKEPKLTIDCDVEREHDQDDDDDIASNRASPVSTNTTISSSSLSVSSPLPTTGIREQADESSRWFWSAWNAKAHLEYLSHQRPETACLDGLKVVSMLWVIGGHIMAIQSSTGAGYLNPKDFFPPRGITTSFLGQLLFSSRFAVDTFLCISGYLAAHVLKRKLKKPIGQNSRFLEILKVVAVIIFRMLRILPLYMCCLGFWMFLAPHMGSGIFWYQWENFLEPCRESWWTNILFVNNILPWGISTEGSCFYHSWYLAVDVQLFCLFAPWLVLIYQSSPAKARKLTLGLWWASTIVTAILAYTQGWSINSSDGLSVAIFDIEGYGKPHVRAQSYLAGMLVAFWPRRVKPSTNGMMVLVLSGLTMLSFVTVTGAYSRRACSFQESPFEGDDCGSTWSPLVNFLYTAFSRAAWSVCIAVLMHFCILGDDSRVDSGTEEDRATAEASKGSGLSVTGMVRNILSW